MAVDLLSTRNAAEEAIPELDSEEISSLTDAQDKVLSLLPILPAIFSVIASSTIIYLVYRAKFNSPYKRILFGLSCSDIITSVTFALQPFLLPQATSQRIWASGTDDTCTILGIFTQIGICSLLYTSMLSYYYLFTIRFGMKDDRYAKMERCLHVLCVGYPLTTVIIGAGLGVYHEVELGPGCYITDYPEGCSDDTGECKSPLIAWIFSGIIVMFTLFSIIINNIVIFWFVRRQLQAGIRRSMNSETQSKRIREVAKQAFLYVAAFLGTYLWTLILRIMESMRYDAEDEAELFPILVLQAIFVPSTGVFNLCIYLRPRYEKVRSDYPLESRVWVVRRALYGEAVQERISSTSSASTSRGGSFFSRTKSVRSFFARTKSRSRNSSMSDENNEEPERFQNESLAQQEQVNKRTDDNDRPEQPKQPQPSPPQLSGSDVKEIVS